MKGLAMLKRVLIENYRSCLHTEIDLHPRLSVLIGPNGSGKTNILQGIMLLSKIAREDSLGEFHKDTTTVASGIKVVFRQRRAEVQLTAVVQASTGTSNTDILSSSRQKWTAKNSENKKISLEIPISLASRWWRDGGSHGYTIGNKYFRYATARGYRLFRLEKDIPRWTRAALSRVAEFCAGMKYYGASQFTNPGTCPASFQIEEQEGRLRRFSRFGGHERVLYSMYSAQKADAEQYKQFLDIVGPQGLKLIDALSFREVRTSSIDYSVRVGGKVERRKRNRLLVIPQFRIGKQKLSPNQLSEGTFKTLALLFHVITEEGTALLIEEPEVCVHHGLLSSILELIKSSSSKKQIILSTHSDYVLDHVKPENVYRVTSERSGGTTVNHIPKSMTSKEYSALKHYLSEEGNLGEYWREGGLGDRP